MSEQHVRAEVRNHVGHLTLDRPAGLNALTLQMVRDLQRQLQAWADDSGVYAVVLRSASEKAFCAGGDIRSLYDSYTAGDDLHERFFVEEYALDQYIHAYGKPLLALIDGFCLGGGMGLVQGAALRVITERTRMGMPETAIGYFPDVGGSYFLPRLPGELGLYLGVTGQQVRSADALYARLADWCLAHEQIGEFDRCLDRMSWLTPPHEALRTLLATLATQKVVGSELKAMQPAIDLHFARATVADIRRSLLDEQRPEFASWAEDTVKIIDSRSPLAMEVTLQMLRRGRTLPLAECFALELHLDRQWFAKGDLIEGVRALIIDKDKNPRWNPATLDAVTPALVDDFFKGFQPSRRA